MTSDSVLAIIFIVIIAAAGIARIGLKRLLLAKVILGVGALALTGIAYMLNNNTIPTWILALSGILILVDAWLIKRKQK